MRLVLDWDGTVTETDTLHMLLERFGDREIYDRAEDDLHAGRATYRQIMEDELATIRVPLDEARAFLAEHARMRPGFAELARERGPTILSSGFHELIEPLLAREGLELEVRANRLDPRPDGWRVLWRDEDLCGECGDLCKRGSLPPGPVVFVGDGYSDRCAALAAERVFARDGLAEYLESRDYPYEPFRDFRELAARL